MTANTLFGWDIVNKKWVPVQVDALGNLKVDGVAKSDSGTYIGNFTINRAIAHGLGVTPKLVIIWDWQGAGNVWFRIFGSRARIACHDGTSAQNYAVTQPDATNFYVGNVSDYYYSANVSGRTYDWVAIS